MANTIITKNSSTASAVPTSGDLVQGELAVNVTDKRLFTENSGGTVVELGTNPSQLNFVDNAKAIFGAGSDLQIYHDGTTSKIDGAVTLTSNVTLGDASTDTVTVNGTMGVGGAGSASTGLRVNNTALTGANQFGFISDITATSGATNNITGYYARINTAAATYTTVDAFNIQIRDVVKGAGHTITSQHGVYIADQTQGTNNYGITSLVSSGTNKWNIYASGTANNYFAGNVGIGTNAPDAKLTILDGATFFKIYQSTTNEMMLTVGASERMLFGINGSEKMRLDSSGNVGIGTSSPTRPLHVYSSNTTNTPARFQSNVTTGAFATFGDANTTGELNVRVGAVGDSLILQTAGTARATIDSSGNLGLGVTPSAWGLLKALDVSSSGALFGYTAQAGISNNAYFDGSNWKYKNTAAAAFFRANAGAFEWHTAASGTAGNTISLTQAMTLDASGRLGVGTTGPAAKVHIAGSSTTDFDALTLRNGDGTVGSAAVLGFEASSGTLGDDAALAAQIKGIRTGSGTSGALTFWTNNAGVPAERARIDSSGNLGLGVTPTSLIGAGYTQLQVNGSSSGVIDVFANSTLKMRIAADGNKPTIASRVQGEPLLFSTTPTGGSATERARIDSSGNLLVGTTSLGTSYGASSGVIKQTGGVFTNRGQFSATGGSTTTITTLANASNNQSYIITVRQSGLGGNSVMAYVMVYGLSTEAVRVAQGNTNPALDMNITMSGTSIQLVLGSGFGSTTWDWVLTRLG